MTRRYLDWITWESEVVGGTCGGPERGGVRKNGSNNLLDCVWAESRARREKMIQNTPVALLATVCRCLMNRSFESSTRPRQQKGH